MVAAMAHPSGELPHGFKLVTVWLLIGLAVFLAVQWGLAQQRSTRISVDGAAIELRRGPDGHFHWPGRVNGTPIEFLVDTGATRTALPRRLAERVGLPVEGRVRSSTAGGDVEGTMARADIELQGGVSASRLRVIVLPDLAAPLLGMDVLSRMRFSQHAGVLRFEPVSP
jgi:aspartyl protease family protein